MRGLFPISTIVQVQALSLFVGIIAGSFALPASSQEADLGEVNQLLTELLPQVVEATTPEERRNAIIASSREQLASMQGPDVGVSVPADLLIRTLTTQIDQALAEADTGGRLSFDASSVAVGSQEISATVPFEAEEASLGLRLGGQATLAVAIGTAPGRIDLTPEVEALAIISVNRSGGKPLLFGEGALRAALNAALSFIVTQVNAHLPTVPIEVPAPTPLRVDLAQATQDTPGLSISPSLLEAPSIDVGSFAILIDEAGLLALADVDAEVDRTGAAATPPADAERVGLEEYRGAFFERWSSRFGEPSRAAEVFLAKSRLADLLNTTLAGAQIDLSYSVAQDFLFPGTKLGLVERPSYSCNSPRQCSFSSTADQCQRRSCDYSCYVRGFWGGGLDDPVCLSGRTACNISADAEFGSCQLARNTEANLAKADCDRLREQEELGCEIGRSLQNVFSEIGDIANVGGDARVQGTARLEDLELTVGPDLSAVIARGVVSAQTDVQVGIDFMPLDIGHVLTCPFPGKVFFNGSASLPAQDRQLTVGISPASADRVDDNPATLDLLLRIEAFTLEAQINPPPLRGLIEQNPQLAFVCTPVLTAVTGNLITLGNASAMVDEATLRRAAEGNPELVALLTGLYLHEQDSIETTITVPSLSFQIDEEAFQGVVSVTDTAVVLRVQQPE